MKSDDDHAKQDVVDWIRALILSGDLRPGTLISEQELADRFARAQGMRRMSRTPIRQALARLAGEGFIETRSRVGSQVRLVSADDAIHIMGLRYGIETVVVCHLAEATYTPLDFTKAKDSIALMRGFAKVNRRLTLAEKTQFIEADIEFHTELARLAGYGPAVDPLRTFSGQFLVAALLSIEDPQAREAVAKEHQLILDAIDSRKAVNARNAMHEHLYETLKRWSPYAAEYLRKVVPGYFGLPPITPARMRKQKTRASSGRRQHSPPAKG